MSEKTPVVSIVMFMDAAMLRTWCLSVQVGRPERGRHPVFLPAQSPYPGGLLCYATVMVLFVAAFRIGGALTVLYPIYASSFVFGAVIAWYAYGTPIKLPNILGMLLMVAGIYLMGRQ